MPTDVDKEEIAKHARRVVQRSAHLAAADRGAGPRVSISPHVSVGAAEWTGVQRPDFQFSSVPEEGGGGGAAGGGEEGEDDWAEGTAVPGVPNGCHVAPRCGAATSGMHILSCTYLATFWQNASGVTQVGSPHFGRLHSTCSFMPAVLSVTLLVFPPGPLLTVMC